MNQEQQQEIDELLSGYADVVQDKIRSLRIDEVVKAQQESWQLSDEQVATIAFETYSLLIGTRAVEKYQAALFLNADLGEDKIDAVVGLLNEKVITTFFTFLEGFLKVNPDGLLKAEVEEAFRADEEQGEKREAEEVVAEMPTVEKPAMIHNELTTPVVAPQMTPKVMERDMEVQTVPVRKPEQQIAPEIKKEVVAPMLEQKVEMAATKPQMVTPPLGQRVMSPNTPPNSVQRVMNGRLNDDARVNMEAPDVEKTGVVDYKLNRQTSVPSATVDLNSANANANQNANVNVVGNMMKSVAFPQSASVDNALPVSTVVQAPMPNTAKYVGGGDPYREPVE